MQQDFIPHNGKSVRKRGSKDDYYNYRPLTLLSIPSKITESVICDNIDPHLIKVLHRNQWRYKKGLSTEAPLIYLSETWQLNIDHGKGVGVVFIDFRKAFDSVNHEVASLWFLREPFAVANELLWKPSTICGNNGVKSKLQYVSYRVPQRSFPDPRLCLLRSYKCGFVKLTQPTFYSWQGRNLTNQYGQKTLFMWSFYWLKKSLWHWVTICYFKQHGSRGNFNQWFSSFLSNRTQTTEIDSTKLQCTPRICPKTTSLLALYQRHPILFEQTPIFPICWRH